MRLSLFGYDQETRRGVSESTTNPEAFVGMMDIWVPVRYHLFSNARLVPGSSVIDRVRQGIENICKLLTWHDLSTLFLLPSKAINSQHFFSFRVKRSF
jgi:hypothetical protein